MGHEEAAYWLRNRLSDIILLKAHRQRAECGCKEAGYDEIFQKNMAGQVWEWTTSIYRPYPYDMHDGREDLSVAAARVVRGGNASSPAETLTSTAREVVLPGRQTTGHAYIGFRCVKPLEMMSRASVLQPSS